MTKAQLIEWIENNVNDNGNIGCAMRLLQNNINAINNPPPAFTIGVCKESTNSQVENTVSNEFFERLQSLRNTPIDGIGA